MLLAEERSLTKREGETGGSALQALQSGRVMRLMLSDFRSFASADLRFGDKPVLLLGPNGSGKTNILEAISLLAPGRGLKGAKLGDITRKGSNTVGSGWAISAEISGLAGALRLGTGLSQDAAGRDRRVFRRDGDNAAPSDAAELVRLVWLTPAMDRLFEESSSARRKFLDRLVSALDASHSARLGRYERALAERQRLLNENVGDASWLSSLERILAEEGVAIAASRRQVLFSLKEQIAADGPWTDEQLFPRAELSLEGGLETLLEDKPAVLAEADFERALELGRARDAAAGRALEGAHRTDLRTRHSAKNMPAEECSTGEQKALLLNIVIAHARLIAQSAGKPPVVLLDEVAAHLDARRRDALLDALQGSGAQVFVTGTDEFAFGNFALAAQIFDLQDSRVALRVPSGA